MTRGIETEYEICKGVGERLPTRSRLDTEQSQLEDELLYDRFAIVCPEHKDLIP